MKIRDVKVRGCEGNAATGPDTRLNDVISAINRICEDNEVSMASIVY